MRLIRLLLAPSKADSKLWVDKKIYFGNGQLWGDRKVKYTFMKDWKKIWKAKGNRKVANLMGVAKYLSEDVEIHDAKEVAKEKFQPHVENLSFPWPYTVEGEKGLLILTQQSKCHILF